MQLFIQDPTTDRATFLHEALLQAGEKAIKGGGAFAFATKDGLELVFRDKIFVNFLSKASFDLIIGVDEVTNILALTALKQICNELPNLKAQAFYHDRNGSIFHPKFCWFRYATGGILIVGSGNLTIRGLRDNWEAFLLMQLSAKDITKIELIWNSWTKRQEHCLLPIDDEKVLARAAENIWRSGGGRRRLPEVEHEEQAESGDEGIPPPRQNDEVLIAEIPRASSRWNQANFDLENFQNFFGMITGRDQRRVVLQHVDANGLLGMIENRPGVSVKSQNYRLELSAAAGLEYPDQGRPIGIFVKVAARTFRYRLLMPDDSDYAIVDEFLDRQNRGRSDRMRRVRTDTETLRLVWPESPLWQGT